MSAPKKRRLEPARVRQESSPYSPPSPVFSDSDLKREPDDKSSASIPASIPESTPGPYAPANRYEAAMIVLGYQCDSKQLNAALFNVEDEAIIPSISTRTKTPSHSVVARAWDPEASQIVYALVARSGSQPLFMAQKELLEPHPREHIVKDSKGGDMLRCIITKIRTKQSNGPLFYEYEYEGKVSVIGDGVVRLSAQSPLLSG